MPTIRRPTADRIAAFLAKQAGAAYGYETVGMLSATLAPAGWTADRHRTVLGRGPAAFDRAKAALRRWEMFRLGWAQICPESPPIEPGTAVAVLAKTFGLWTLNPARVIALTDQQDGPVSRYGFTYGSLAGHSETGEERFLVDWDRATDEVGFETAALSRPGRWYSRTARPLTRLVQHRFAVEAGAAMARAVAER